MPRYTRTLGPWFAVPESKPATRAANIRRLTRDLLQQLPAHDRFYHLLDPEDEIFAFAAAGCVVYQHFTFRVDAAESLESVWDNIDGRTRRLIRSATKTYSIQQHFDLDRFTAVSYGDHQHSENHHDFASIRRIFEACVRRNQAVILALRKGDAGAEVASVILVWGGGTLYYWLPALDRCVADGGTNAFLLWEAVKLAKSLHQTFDFDGYQSGRTAKFFTSFGVHPLPRPAVVHTNLLGQLAQHWIDRQRSRRSRSPRITFPIPEAASLLGRTKFFKPLDLSRHCKCLPLCLLS